MNASTTAAIVAAVASTVLPSNSNGGVVADFPDSDAERFWREHRMAVAVLVTSALSMVGSAYMIGSVHNDHARSSARHQRAGKKGRNTPNVAARRNGSRGLRGVSRKGLDLMANPSAALILNIAVTNLLFACAMTASSVSVLVAAEGTLAAFSDNGTMEGLPNPLCQAQGGLSYFFSLASAFLCVALSIASFRLTRGKPFVSNSLGAVAVYLVCYGVPLVMTAVAIGRGDVGFQTQNAWCAVVQNEVWFSLVPGIVSVVVVIVMVSLMATFAAKMHRATAARGGLAQEDGAAVDNRSSGRQPVSCLNLQYMRLLLLCLSFAVITAMAIIAKSVHAIAEENGGLSEMQDANTFAYDIANAVVYCSLGALNALAYGLPQPKVCQALRCISCSDRAKRRSLSMRKSGVFQEIQADMRFDAFFATSEGSSRALVRDNDPTSTSIGVEMPEHTMQPPGEDDFTVI
eukprot:INCI10446.2.p1 GENE.INCI10446.2~~INCI10446.2.p1  ORF type:complete len:460 (-),score=89.96 INCI10446.2:54-1433(-)